MIDWGTDGSWRWSGYVGDFYVSGGGYPSVGGVLRLGC